MAVGDDWHRCQPTAVHRRSAAGGFLHERSAALGHVMRTTQWAKRVGIAAAGLMATCVLTAGAIYVGVQYDGNVHVVESGRVLRSAQPTAARLDAISHQYAIRSVLNLRGDNAGKPWYDEEMRASHADGLVHFDYALSAEHDVTPAQMDELMRIVAAAPKPLLIHCNAGADRTGLVSALYQVSRGVPASQAATQLSLHYGHFPYLWSKTGAMDRSFVVFVKRRAASAPS